MERIYETVEEISKQGTTILLVEQNANFALEVSERAYVLETGTVVLQTRRQHSGRTPKCRRHTWAHDRRRRRDRRQGPLPDVRLARVGDGRVVAVPAEGLRRAAAPRTAGLLLSAVGVLIWLLWPARADSRWKVQGPLGRARRRWPRSRAEQHAGDAESP